ncbi:uncharacterized protein LOC121371191 [Gigantopelta aegis]|uniref:uncharacterized protein LOC121371191 n=1 Tax=Gigantopelta aegis TaxID=1735272 RepID=UPI001B88838F|nr:uncharacterized protein LOC121371191 [Gigantopelta aegis]
MDAAPYDNVEFPVRKPGTGTWPGPGAAQSQTTIKTYTQQASVTKDKSGAKLAPLMESMEVAETEDQRMQAKVYQASSHGTHSSQSSTSSVVSNQKPPVVPQHAGSTPSYNQNKVQTSNTALLSTTSATQPLIKKRDPEPDTDEDDFCGKNLSPESQSLLNTAYTQHKHFYRLNSKIIDEGSALKQDVLDVYRKSGETLTYEQLIQGMLVEGEKLLLGGCWLYFTNVEYFDADGKCTTREPIGRGRICLTSQRLLVLSAEIFTESTVSEFGDPTKRSGGYTLNVTKKNNLFYQNLPLTNFHSAELSAAVGTSAQTKVSVRNPLCWGLCSCLGVGRCSRTWGATPPRMTTFNRRTIRLGVSMPPWATKTIMVVHLDPEMSLTTARDLVSQLQYHAPHLH